MAMGHVGKVAMMAALALPLVGCEAMTGPRDAALRVVMDSEVGNGIAASMISASLAPSENAVPGNRPGNGPISLENVEAISVSVSQVLVLPAAAASAAEGAEKDDVKTGWVPLTVTTSKLNLMALKDVQTLAELSADAGITGIEAVRLVFAESSVRFKDGSTESLFIPSGKVTLETPGLAVGAASTLPLTFLQGASVRKIIRTGRGLLMPPVFEVAGKTQDADEG